MLYALRYLFYDNYNLLQLRKRMNWYLKVWYFKSPMQLRTADKLASRKRDILKVSRVNTIHGSHSRYRKRSINVVLSISFDPYISKAKIHQYTLSARAPALRFIEDIEWIYQFARRRDRYDSGRWRRAKLPRQYLKPRCNCITRYRTDVLPNTTSISKCILNGDTSDTPFGRASALRLLENREWISVWGPSLVEKRRREKERERERENGVTSERGERRRWGRDAPHALRRAGGERERGCARHGMDRRTGERRRSFRGWSGCHGSYPGRAQQTPVLPRRSPSARRLCLSFPSRRCCCSFIASSYAFEPRSPAVYLCLSLFFFFVCDNSDYATRTWFLVKVNPYGAAGICVSGVNGRVRNRPPRQKCNGLAVVENPIDNSRRVLLRRPEISFRKF